MATHNLTESHWIARRSQVLAGGQTQKTRCMKRTLNPVFEEAIEIYGNLNEFIKTGLELKVVDWDLVGSDDPLGDLKVPLRFLLKNSSEEFTEKLIEPKGSKGTLEFSVAWLPAGGVSTYIASRRELLTDVAAKLDVEVEDLVKWNALRFPNLSERSLITASTRLVFEVPDNSSKTPLALVVEGQLVSKGSSGGVDARPADDQVAPSVLLGSRWVIAGVKDIRYGVEIFNLELADALRRTTEFTVAELDSLGVEDLGYDSFIRVGKRCYKPFTSEHAHLMEDAELSPPPSPPMCATNLGHRVRLSSPDEDAAHPPKASDGERSYSYQSLNEVLLKASLTESWRRRDWPAVKKILFGWYASIFLFWLMILSFLLYGCELFEPRDLDDVTNTTAAAISTGARRLKASGGGRGGDSLSRPPRRISVAGNTDELILAWALSAFQRFVLHEPTIILASRALPMMFASSFCANFCGETIVNLLTVFFTGIMACIAEIKG